MRKVLWTNFVLTALLVGIFSGTMLHGLTVWNGSVTTNVIDDDISITGNVTLNPALTNSIYVLAATTNITITPDNNWSITQGAGISPGPVALHLQAFAGHTITLDLSAASLSLVGGGANNNIFLISFTGQGDVRILGGDGQILALTNSVLGGPGAYFMVNMDNVGHLPDAQTVVVTRANQASVSDFVFSVGQNSLLGFMADNSTGTQNATIAFDAMNSGTGRLELNILDGGAVAVQGYLLNVSSASDFSINDIDFTTPAGNRAIFATITSNGNFTSGLLVLNQNTVLPAFRSNPWCLDPNPVGVQPGFVIGSTGQLLITGTTYFDYVGTALNISPTPAIPAPVLNALAVNCVPPLVNQVVKDRNPSALFIDGPVTQCTTPRPLIELEPTSKIYFRSAVGCDGIISNFEGFPFTIDPTEQYTDVQGYGNIVFDVEGTVDVIQSTGTLNSALNILSLYEADTGGSVLLEGTETLFKLRPDPWLVDSNGIPRQYGKSCFLINGRMNLIHTALQHTDELHRVFEKNALQQSEPTYMGGESFRLCKDRLRPHIMYYNAELLLHTSAAFTGLDQATPSLGTAGVGEANNISNFIFYSNGFCVDQGTGRNLILGSTFGGLASDLGTIVDRDAHFDVFQEFEQDTNTLIEAQILTSVNNNKVTQGLPADQSVLANQYSVHSIYLAHGSNSSIGTPALTGSDYCNSGASFTLNSTSTLLVNGSFISMDSQGGLLNQPDTSVETGQGGIFVDQQGIFALGAAQRMNVNTMIGVGFNGIVVMPQSQVEYGPNVGITRSNLDMSDINQHVIIPAGATFSDFTLDWKYTIKNTCPANATPTYIPYTTPAVPAACNAPAVVAANIASVPTVQGTANQLQVFNSRLGDPATIKVDGSLGGGLVRELMFFGSTPDAGVSPEGILVLENNAIVGLGFNDQNIDSTHAAVVLGINGVTLIPNGDAQIFLNADIIINNVAHIVTGPDFGTGETVNQLLITSDVPREIRVKNGGVLDLSQFDNPQKQLLIGGKVTLVFEPGARFVLGGGLFTMIENSVLVCEPYVNPTFVGTSLTSTDPFRVRFGGAGSMTFQGNSSVNIPRGALVGIESIGTTTTPEAIFSCPVVTDLFWILEDSAHLNIGSSADFGGALQIGNTASVTNGSVSWTLIINGPGVQAQIATQGMLGLGVGQIDKPAGTFNEGAPNNWTVAPLFNVTETTINIVEGTFKHNAIFDGSSGQASLMALGAASVGHTFFLQPTNQTGARVLGGGNLVQISGQTAPTVLTQDGVIDSNLSAGILASRNTLDDPSKTVPAFPTTATALFNYLKANPYIDTLNGTQQITKHAQAAENHLGIITIGWINGTVVPNQIVRKALIGVRDDKGGFGDPTRSLQLGAVCIQVSTNGDATATLLRS